MKIDSLLLNILLLLNYLSAEELCELLILLNELICECMGNGPTSIFFIKVLLAILRLYGASAKL